MPTSSSYFSSGYKGKKKPQLASTHETGGTSGDLSIPGYVPETPVDWSEYENLGSAGTGALPASVATDPVKAVAPLGPDPRELAANLLAGNLLPKNTALSDLLGDDALQTGGVSAASIMDEPEKPKKLNPDEAAKRLEEAGANPNMAKAAAERMGPGALDKLLAANEAGYGQPVNKPPKVAEPKKVKVPKIEPLGAGGGSTEFAEWFSHYSGMDPRVAAGWVMAEGAGETGTTGGEAGKDNWLAARYPGSPTTFSQTQFNEGPQAAAKKTVEWMEGKAGAGTEDEASSGIQEILPKIRGKSLSPEEQVRAIGESGWLGGSAGELPTDYMNNILSNASSTNVSGHYAAPSSAPQSSGVPGVPAGEKRLPSSVWFGHKAENKFGLDVGENPAFGGVDPVHTEGSYHYQRDPKGRGEAIDVSGDPEKMMAFDKWVAENYPGITELFYDPGVSIDNGAPSGPIGGHSDHVHVSAVPGTLFPISGEGEITVPEGGGEFSPFSGGSVAAPEGGGAPEEILNAALDTASTSSEPVAPTQPTRDNNLQMIMSLLEAPTPTVDDPTALLRRKDDLLKLAMLGRGA